MRRRPGRRPVAPLADVRPGGMAFTPDGKHVYVTNRSGSVLVLETATKIVVGTIPMRDSNPGAIAFASDGKHAYVTTSDTVAVLDISTNAVVATVPIARFVSDIAIIPLPPVPR